jgi:hypothetical protein
MTKELAIFTTAFPPASVTVRFSKGGLWPGTSRTDDWLAIGAALSTAGGPDELMLNDPASQVTFTPTATPTLTIV